MAKEGDVTKKGKVSLVKTVDLEDGTFEVRVGVDRRQARPFTATGKTKALAMKAMDEKLGL